MSPARLVAPLVVALACVASPALAQNHHWGRPVGGGGWHGGGQQFERHEWGGQHWARPVPHYEYHPTYRNTWSAPRYERGYGWGVSRPWGEWRGRVEFGSPTWRGGHWFHGWRAGRLGWWWIINDGGYYYYPTPTYPYPQVSASVVAPYDSTPVTYYCRSVDATYPQVQDCPEGWETFRQ